MGPSGGKKGKKLQKKALFGLKSVINGKILKTALEGTNPYVYTDWENNVLFDQQGVPLGSNGGILKALSEVFGFSLNISIFNSNVIWDNQTGQYVAIPTLVCVILLHVFYKVRKYA